MVKWFWAAALLMLIIGGNLAEAQERDPTKPPAVANEPMSPETLVDVQLSQIVYSKSKKMAIINNKRLVEGDTVGGFTVLEILPSEVHLNRSGERITLSLFQPLTELNSGAEQ